jgi:hypothetical protein
MPLFYEIISKVNQLPSLDEDLSVAWVGASTEGAISAVEKALGVSICGSYRDFILATGGGGLDTLYISPISANDPLSGCCADTLRYREEYKIPKHLVVIQRCLDDNEPMCLDTSKVFRGENPVIIFYHQSTGNSEKIANSFIEYYQAYLSPYFEEPEFDKN